MNLKFGLSQINSHAPKWLINTAAVLTLLIAAKHQLISGIPSLAEETKLMANAWFDYILDIVQCLLAIAVIFSAEDYTKKN